jgi:chain length determinant protein (polysaccharide antigen chain regulator)
MSNQMNNSSVPVSEPQIVYTHYRQQPYEDDEINLLDIWRVLVRKKYLLVGVTLAVTLAASAYAFFAQPFYKAEIFLLPPLAKDVHGLNFQALNINEHSSASVYNLFVRNLHSRAFRMRMFKEQNLADLLAPDRDPNSRIEDVFESTFNQALTVSRNLRKKSLEDFITVSFETRDTHLSAKVLNDFIRLVNAETISILSQNVEEKINSRKQLLQNQIASKRKMAQLRREDRIQVLEDAALVAEVLGIVDNTVPTIMNGPTTPIVAVNNSQLPMYMRGTKSLRVVAKTLRQRSIEDPFINGLRELQEQLVLLESITFNRDSIAAVTIDQWAIPPKTPAKPKRLLITAIGFVLSLMMGVLLAFFLNTLEQQREQLKSS